MSRSPTEQSTEEERQAYSSAWKAINSLLKRGKSESGHERNCCFLNLHGTDAEDRNRFATVSAAISADFPDDARGLALCDWDRDGRVDFWITNRTAPRVRLMLNRFPTPDLHWLGLKLNGTAPSTNRDAIGARIEVHLPGGGTPLLRTVSGGSGFLSQSSLWQHFGLGKAKEVAKVVVRWPGGAAETFTGLAVDRFHTLTQGGGAKPISWPDVPSMHPSSAPPAPAAESETARLVLLTALPLPVTFLPEDPGTKGMLLNLWSASCPHCQEELKTWGPKLKDWTAQGLTVSSWCVDRPAAEAEKVAKAAGFGGKILTTSEQGGAGLSPESLLVLNCVQKGSFGLQADMPVPTTFLLDEYRRLVAIYKGPVSPAQIEADLKLLDLGHLARVTAACPDQTGRWLEPPQAIGVKGVAAMLLENGLNPQAEQLLKASADWHKRAVSSNDPLAENWRRKELSASQNLLALFDLERQDLTSAERRYNESIAAQPSLEAHRGLVNVYTAAKDPRLYPRLAQILEFTINADPIPSEMAKLGVLKLELGDPVAAESLLARSLAQVPDPMNYFQLGQARMANGKPKDAVAAWSKALELNPSLVPALGNLAWARATQADASLRNGAEAVKLATQAVNLTKGRHPVIMGILAVAHAEAGDFKKALETAQAAQKSAETAGDSANAQKIGEWIKQIQDGRPIREK